MTDPLRSNPCHARRTVRAIIAGRVQGVGYRAWTQAEAAATGVSGWVRNRANGDVEALLSGPPAAVDALCARLWRGPTAARVERVDICAVEDPAAEAASGFRQIATI